MAEKSSEEYPHDKADDFSETATPSNNIADKNDDDTSGTICTIPSSSKIMPEMFLSLDEEFSVLGEPQPLSLTQRNLYMQKIVGTFFDGIIYDNKYKNRDDDILVDINTNINNEPNFYASNNKIIQRNKSGTFYETNLSIVIDPRLSGVSILENNRKFPKVFFSFNEPYQLQLPLSRSLTYPSNLDVSLIKEGQEYIDFMSIFTDLDFCRPFLEKIFSHLTYRDIASMVNVSKNWRKAVLKSVTAQKKLEKVFTNAILYFSHENANVTDEYKQLYNNILIHFKNQIQFKKQNF